MTPEQEVVRLRVALSKGLTVEQAARLNGDTEEALTADADALLAAFPAPVAEPQTPRGPQLQHGTTVPNVGSGVDDGAARYAAQHNRPEAQTDPARLGSPENPVTRAGYRLER